MTMSKAKTRKEKKLLQIDIVSPNQQKNIKPKRLSRSLYVTCVGTDDFGPG